MIERVAIVLTLLFVGTAPTCAEEIDGFGRTLADAKLDARQHTLERLQEKLASREPPLIAWRPTLADVEGFLEGPGAAGGSVHVEPLGIQIRWKLAVRFPTDQEMALRDRQARLLPIRARTTVRSTKTQRRASTSVREAARR